VSERFAETFPAHTLPHLKQRFEQLAGVEQIRGALEKIKNFVLKISVKSVYIQTISRL